MMRILLFLGMQVAILLVVSIVGSILASLFGIRLNGGSMVGLLVMCAVWGFAGSLISLFMSKWMVKRAYGVEVIEVPRTRDEQFLFNTVQMLANKAGIPMPEVGIYQSNDLNAFATGASKNNSLVAVSTALLNNMNEKEVVGVLGHEISHIKNGDMVTMTLLQGVLNTFVYFFAYIAAMAIEQATRRNDESSSGHSFAFYGVKMIFEILFGVVANIILMWFSRYREYRADAGSASLEGVDTMIASLEALKNNYNRAPNENVDASMQALCIFGASSVSELFASHPPLDKRIEALRNLKSF